MTQDNLKLSADSPLQNPSEDALGYSGFAEHLAKAISRMVPREGLVISINGPWGSGKSTLLNFVLFYLNQFEEKDRPLILHFNPWWFSGREDLTRLLIGQLRASLGDKDYGELKARLANLADLLSKIPAIPGKDVGEFFADKLRGEADILALKNKIGKLLVEQEKRILVIVDDIDRLTPEEVKDLFRTIKAIGNFPNVIYLLAFDTAVVANALEQANLFSGQDYLEKIVQVPFELPQPDTLGLQELLFDGLNQVLGEVPEELFDSDRWENVYSKGLKPALKTPRGITRLVNSLRATYLAVINEVNAVDFIAIEFLRIFNPKVYDFVKNSEGRLTENGFSLASLDEGDNNQSYFESLLSSLPSQDRCSVKNILAELFPKFASAYEDVLVGSESFPDLRRQRRICCEENFSTYFRLSLSPDAISTLEIRDLIDKTGDQQKFSAALLAASKQRTRLETTRLRGILDLLRDHTEKDIPKENICSVVSSFLDVGDQFLVADNEPQNLFGFRIDLLIGRIIYDLLERLGSRDRFECLSRAIQEGKALALAEHMVTGLGKEHGKLRRESLPESDRIVTPEQLEALESLVLEKIRSASQDGSLLQTPQLLSILFRWKTWSQNEEVKRWVAEVASQDTALIRLLEQFLAVSRGNHAGSMRLTTKVHFDYNNFTIFADPSEYIERSRKINHSSVLTPTQQAAVSKFIQEYDHRRGDETRREPWDFGG